jgi:hypothetical protein
MIHYPCPHCGVTGPPLNNSQGARSCSTCYRPLSGTTNHDTSGSPTLADFNAMMSEYATRVKPHPAAFEVHPVHVADVERAVARGLYTRGRGDLQGRMRVVGVPEMDRTTMVVRDQYGKVYDLVMLKEEDDAETGMDGPDVRPAARPTLPSGGTD